MLQLTLSRSDGVSVTVMRMLEALDVTLERETHNAIHHLHASHRSGSIYDIYNTHTFVYAFIIVINGKTTGPILSKNVFKKEFFMKHFIKCVFMKY